MNEAFASKQLLAREFDYCCSFILKRNKLKKNLKKLKHLKLNFNQIGLRTFQINQKMQQTSTDWQQKSDE